MQTVLQQLPGGNLRVFKVISRHHGQSGQPTVLRYRFDTSVTVSDQYTYLGHPGVLLVDPDGSSDLLAGHRGKPIGFLTEPVALDAASQPVGVTWILKGRTLEVRVDDRAGTAYPVVVDPTFYPSFWMTEAKNGVSLLTFAESKGGTVHKSAGSEVGPDILAALTAIGCPPRSPLTWVDATGGFFRAVWVPALPCMDRQ